MATIHDSFTEPMRDRLKTTVMGLGLARLLQRARRFDEAREILQTLEAGVAQSEESRSRPCCKPSSIQHGEVNEPTVSLA